MCEYCKNLRNSDDVDSVMLDSDTIGEIMGRKISLAMWINCYEYGESGIYKISAMLDAEKTDIDAVVSTQIYFCPMCGRKLKTD